MKNFSNAFQIEAEIIMPKSIIDGKEKMSKFRKPSLNEATPTTNTEENINQPVASSNSSKISSKSRSTNKKSSDSSKKSRKTSIREDSDSDIDLGLLNLFILSKLSLANY